jgi:hypothetical protein
MKCVVCGKQVPFRLADDGGGMHPWCSDPCGAKWRTRNNFLFDLKSAESKKAKSISGLQVVAMAMDQGWLDNDLSTLSQLSQVSKNLRPVAMEHEVLDFKQPAVHKQQQGTKEVSETKITKRSARQRYVDRRHQQSLRRGLCARTASDHLYEIQLRRCQRSTNAVRTEGQEGVRPGIESRTSASTSLLLTTALRLSV